MGKQTLEVRDLSIAFGDIDLAACLLGGQSALQTGHICRSLVSSFFLLPGFCLSARQTIL